MVKKYNRKKKININIYIEEIIIFKKRKALYLRIGKKKKN